jgi:ABC-type branched-subunit amino acid transport system ATPase component
MTAAPLLSIDGVGKRFGGVAALDRVSFRVEANTVAGLIGPNGSGKTTLLNVVNGVLLTARCGSAARASAASAPAISPPKG